MPDWIAPTMASSHARNAYVLRQSLPAVGKVTPYVT
jgi:hypothetical protein